MKLPDLLVVVTVMLAVTYLGHRLSGSITNRQGFFQADGSLPWWAVSASIIATVVSAVTFVSVPAAVFADGGDLTYFQVILGLAAGKVVIARLLATPFYLSQGVNTSYEYIGARIDVRTGEFSMYLGLLLNLINSAVKLLTASLVLDVISGWGLPGCALFVVAISIVWSALAGIKTVIWTDFVLFILFSVGAVFALFFVSLNIQQGIGEAIIWLDDQAKLVLFDFDTDPSKRYTIWAGVIGAVGLSIAQASTQGTWQRVRACRSVDDAQKAFDVAALFYIVHVVILGVGLALAVFYAERGVSVELAQQLSQSPDRIFPYFIVNELPVGISGLFIAAIFAAAISTLDSALTESSDLTVNHIYQRVLPNKTEAHYLLASRLLMVVWGLLFFAAAMFFSRYQGVGLLELTFKLPNYFYGAIFASIILARFGIGRFSTIILGFVLATLSVLAMAEANVAFFYWCPVSGVLMVATVWALDRRRWEITGIVSV
ncbi:MAG: sodium:solute symporter family transporter [Candidatus Azotimanducaceae bacterium]|tara:strand:+ start:586 stop:2046 length:1461 start_codon:yes stop_codon:yes gene_type:complete